jgi:hypothetical protein
LGSSVISSEEASCGTGNLRFLCDSIVVSAGRFNGVDEGGVTAAEMFLATFSASPPVPTFKDLSIALASAESIGDSPETFDEAGRNFERCPFHELLFPGFGISAVEEGSLWTFIGSS